MLYGSFSGWNQCPLLTNFLIADPIQRIYHVEDIPIEVKIDPDQVRYLAPFFGATLGPFQEIVVIIQDGGIYPAG